MVHCRETTVVYLLLLKLVFLFFLLFSKIIQKILFRIDVSNLHKNFHSLFAYETW